MSACVNIERATTGGFCHTLVMASPELSMSVLSAPAVKPRPEENLSPVTSVKLAHPSSPSPSAPSIDPTPKRLVVDAKDISLTFDTADGRVDALSHVDLQVAE